MEHFPINNFLGLETGLNVPNPNSMKSGKNFVRNRTKGALEQCLGYQELFTGSDPGLPTTSDSQSVHYLDPNIHRIFSLTWLGITSFYVKEHGGKNITVAYGKYLKKGFHKRSLSMATNATPIVVTATADHNHRTGDTVWVEGVAGNTAANGYWKVTKLNLTQLVLDGSVGNSGYVNGGVMYAAQERLGIWVRPYWDGEAWVDRWRELTEMFIFEYLGYVTSRDYYKIDDGTIYNFDGIDPTGTVFNQTYFRDWVAAYLCDRLSGDPTIVQYIMQTLYSGANYYFTGDVLKYPDDGEKIFAYRNFLSKNHEHGYKTPTTTIDPFCYSLENEARLITRMGGSTPLTMTAEDIGKDVLFMLGFRNKTFGWNNHIPTTISIIGATNATPIVIQTAVAHLRQTGDEVVISGVTGNTAANGTWTVTRVDDTHFSLDGSSGNGAYVSAGAIANSKYRVDRLIVDNAQPDVFDDAQYPTVESVVTPVSVAAGTVLAASVGPDGKIFIQTTVALNVPTGAIVTISGVTGLTDANGTWVATYFSPDTFSLDGSDSSQTYISGGNVAFTLDPFEEGVWFHGITVVYDDGNETSLLEKSSITLPDSTKELDWTVNVLRAAISKRAAKLRFYLGKDGDYYYLTKEIGLLSEAAEGDAPVMTWTNAYQVGTNIRVVRSDFTNSGGEIRAMIGRSGSDEGFATFNHAVPAGSKVIASNFVYNGVQYPNRAVISVANGDGGSQKDVFPFTALNTLDFEYGDGDELRACAKIGLNRYLMLKRLSLVVLVDNGNGLLLVENILKGVGIASIRTLCEYGDAAYWLDYNGFYSYSVNGLELLNPTFEQDIRELSDAVKEAAVGEIDRENKTWRVALDGKEYVYTPPLVPPRGGIDTWMVEERVDVVERFAINEDGELVFLSASKLYVADGSVLMGGVDFDMQYETNKIELPAPVGQGFDALIQQMYVEYESEVDINVNLYLDDEVTAINPSAYVLEAGGARSLMLSPLGCLCKGFRLKFTASTSGSNATAVKIKRAGVYYDVLAQRGDML